jgi:2-polyprenyl-3-methyl-5-hydroxy-6-metoxy-1,4-benzoquinol methylase
MASGWPDNRMSWISFLLVANPCDLYTDLMANTEVDEPAASEDPDHDYWERYAAPIDFDNAGDSRAIALGFLSPEPQRVLELGCSAGYMTKVMSERGHRVTAVEIDPVAARLATPFADRMFIGDLDRIESDGQHLLSELEPGGFDTLVAADVLEHLRDPVGCLRRVRDLVETDGKLILSIPNVAHGDVRLALVAGRFDYQDSGLLDRTHVQMFTLETLVAMIREVGLAPVEWKRVRVPLGGSEIEIDENLLEFGRRAFSDDPEFETYQWVVSCLDATVAGSSAVWPAPPNVASIAAEVNNMMNTPVAHPSDVGSPDSLDVVETTPARPAVRRLRGLAASCRDRVVARLVR